MWQWRSGRLQLPMAARIDVILGSAISAVTTALLFQKLDTLSFFIVWKRSTCCECSIARWNWLRDLPDRSVSRAAEGRQTARIVL